MPVYSIVKLLPLCTVDHMMQLSIVDKPHMQYYFQLEVLLMVYFINKVSDEFNDILHVFF